MARTDGDLCSCSPNTRYDFDKASFAVRLFAARDIPAGEELTLMYVDLTMSAAERQAGLAGYGFTCTCIACTNPKKSDARRAEIARISPPRYSTWYDDPSLPDDYLSRQSLRYIELCKQEGLESLDLYTAHWAQLNMVYAALADAKRCRETAKMALRWHIKAKDRSARSRELAELLASPTFKLTDHPAWKERIPYKRRR